MKIPGSIPSTQSFQTQAAGAHSLPAQHGSDGSVNFPAPRTLHPANGSVGLFGEILSKFRDSAALAGRISDRTDGVGQLKQQIARQFGDDIAGKIFNK